MGDDIKDMFSRIHKRYDLMNHVLSFGIDKSWRKSAVYSAMIEKKSYRLLDIATGTGDLAIMIKKRGIKKGKDIDIEGIDFNEKMLGFAKVKSKKLGLDIKFSMRDALATEFPDNYFDVITSSFALRDFDSLEQFVDEAYRIMKKNGKIVLLEMSLPKHGINKYVFNFYVNVMRFEGALIDNNAYSFLIKSIKEFDKDRLLALLKKKGFGKVECRALLTNAAFLVTAVK
ncbi:ubiquinone/menaquinone biosynthesis methyltransferase [Candidatus Marsarchaeota archaeon]|jgi:demethylmenaquinone methyltransferase/2-methoxy-6-polyprenyl-1,4-benzoquinol methylase|nr:ubiquinone/menaquinone biosynthesis methyltransferase [Candidatus Marsarchaeota archaeon]MCL5089834.1 ubiquinone/menaquinone biosynthesis methyltransferase [Candidatus Marsarchaeota archaeon]